MSPNKKTGWLIALAFIEFILIIILVKSCASKDINSNEKIAIVCQTPQAKRAAPEPVEEYYEDEEYCDKDDDCPSDSSCQNKICVITNPTKGEAGDDTDEEPAIEEDDSARSCDSGSDCGCGYNCEENRCRKLKSSFCCANADCATDEFCYFGDGFSNTNGTCKTVECNTNDDCGICGMTCSSHICKQSYCCSDDDCPNGQLCATTFYYFGANRSCKTPECTSDADCGCGKLCDTTSYVCISYSEDRRLPCCGTDFYYGGQCWPHSRIEDGRCLEDYNCPKGKICYNNDVCIPETCEKNSDCGCNAVCRKEKCELEGCDTNADCCEDPELSVCDRGKCINPNEDNEDDE